MPWKASSVMEERLRFVARLLGCHPSHFEAYGRFNRSIEWRSLADGWRNPGTCEPPLDSNLRACPGGTVEEIS
jgi:hypothetical protein